MRKSVFDLISLIFFLVVCICNSLYGIRIGLDSGHSIKELYKGGCAFWVKVKKSTGGEESKLYYSVGWPAGGVKFYLL